MDTIHAKLDQLPKSMFKKGSVAFREIKDDDDLWYATVECKLTDEQKELVNPAGFSIGRAYLHPENHFPCIICNEEDEPIGFIDLDVWLGQGDAFSWSYYIDISYQGRGYGKQAAKLAVEILKAVDANKPIKLSAEADNTRAHKLYLDLGFKQLEELDGDDFVFSL